MLSSLPTGTLSDLFVSEMPHKRSREAKLARWLRRKSIQPDVPAAAIISASNLSPLAAIFEPRVASLAEKSTLSPHAIEFSPNSINFDSELPAHLKKEIILRRRHIERLASSGVIFYDMWCKN